MSAPPFVHSYSIIYTYSQISLEDQNTIIDNYKSHHSQNALMNSNPLIDENNIRYIIRMYLNHWKERLLSEKISQYPIFNLIPACFIHYSRQFMQIKNVPNILFVNTT